MSTATRPGTYESFEDVKRACHAWLMKRNPHYRNTCNQMAAHRGKKARNHKHEAPNEEDAGPLGLPLCEFPEDL